MGPLPLERKKKASSEQRLYCYNESHNKAVSTLRSSSGTCSYPLGILFFISDDVVKMMLKLMYCVGWGMPTYRS